MRHLMSSNRQPVLAVLLFLWVCFSSSSVFATTVETLNFGKWSLISIPADPGATGTVEAVFGDDLAVAEYGSNWLIYAFDSDVYQYRLLALDELLEANKGYWIFQRVADPVMVDIPDNLASLSGVEQTGCPVGRQCVSVPLTTNSEFAVWNAVGYSSDSQASFGETRFVTASGVCAQGCTPDEALKANVAQSVMFTLNSDGTSYEVITEATPMQPWDGYWLLALPNADQLRWVVPAEAVTTTPPTTPPVDNQPPVAVDDTRGPLDAGGKITFAVTANDTDTDGNIAATTVKIVQPPAFGTATVTAGGLIFYSHSGTTGTGADTLTYTVEDNKGAVSNAATVTISPIVDPEPEPEPEPVATLIDDSVTSVLGIQTIAGNVATNDTIPADAVEQGLLFIVSNQPENGKAHIDEVTGDFIYQPNTGFTGDDFFIYSLVQLDENQNPASILASARVNVTIDNLVLVDDSLIALSGVEVGGNVLSNDNLPDNAIERGLQLQVIEQPVNGFVTLDPVEGTYSYVSNRGFSGQDTFVYGVVQVDDNQQVLAVAVEATVSVDVEPIVVEDDKFSGVSGQGVFGVAGDNDILPQAAAVRGLLLRVQTLPQNGTVEMNPVTGAFTYVSNASFYGTDTFTYALVQVDQQGTELGIITDDARVEIDVSPPVVFYKHWDYRGTGWPATVGWSKSIPADGRILNDHISSIRVAPGFSVIACNGTGWGGECRTYLSNASRLKSQSDRISSYIITRLPSNITSTPNGVLRDYTITGLSGLSTGDTVAEYERIRCAGENEICTLPDGSAYTVFYGAGNTFTRMDNVTGSIRCYASVFGDPVRGTRKSCEYVALSDTLDSDQGYVVTEQPAKGSVLMSPTGRYLYMPASKFAGTDSFRYALVRFNQTGGVAETLAEATVTVDLTGILSFDGDFGSYNNVIGTYELDSRGNPTNLRGLLINSNTANFGQVLGAYKTLPRLFVITNVGDRASENSRIQWDGTNGVYVDGRAVPRPVIWIDKRFNANGRNLVRYTPTDDGDLIIGFEDALDGNDFDDIKVRLNFNPLAD